MIYQKYCHFATAVFLCWCCCFVVSLCRLLSVFVRDSVVNFVWKRAESESWGSCRFRQDLFLCRVRFQLDVFSFSCQNFIEHLSVVWWKDGPMYDFCHLKKFQWRVSVSQFLVNVHAGEPAMGGWERWNCAKGSDSRLQGDTDPPDRSGERFYLLTPDQSERLWNLKRHIAALVHL